MRAFCFLHYFFLLLFLIKFGIEAAFAKTDVRSRPKGKTEQVLKQNFQTPHDYDYFIPSLLSELDARPNELIQDNRLNRFLKKKDTRGYFSVQYDYYLKELTPGEAEDAKKRVGNFLNRWLMGTVNEKYPIFQGNWRKKDEKFEITDSMDTLLVEEEENPLDKLKTEASYRIRSDRAELELRNDILTVVGKAYYKGEQEFVLKKYFAELGLEAFYFIRPKAIESGNSTFLGNEFVLEKSLIYHIKAKTSMAKESRIEGATPVSAAKLELLFHNNF